MNKIDLKNPPKCKKCSEPMLMMFGYGWDYDRWLCGTKGCYFEIELKSTTVPKER